MYGAMLFRRHFLPILTEALADRYGFLQYNVGLPGDHHGGVTSPRQPGHVLPGGVRGLPGHRSGEEPYMKPVIAGTVKAASTDENRGTLGFYLTT